MIGIILSPAVIKDSLSGTGSPVVQFYEELANKNNVDLCFYSFKRLSLKTRTVNGLVYEHRNGERARKTVPVPKVNLYRGYSYLKNKESIDKVRYFIKNHTKVFLNVLTNEERGKYSVHKYLETVDDLGPSLPETSTLSFSKMKDMADRYDKVYIKPKHSCKGNNIYMLEKSGSGFTMSHIKSANQTVKQIPDTELRNYYSSTFKTPGRFIVQEGISSRKYKNQKFDLRVFTQKNKSGKWQVTKIYVRIADQCPFVSNADQGGRLKFNVNPVLEPAMKKQVKKACIKTAKALEAKNPHIVDLGLDVAIDKNNEIWLIEANFRPYRSKFDSKHYKVLFEHAVWCCKQNMEHQTADARITTSET
ncbi:YheC/YheD family protein [Salipaludibacillus aurantiacus]|uniref:YheC/D like ATP-grasp n=1 Tax=Salipaludibacillus aurantiacus TaxID=1601833 RepID=A0A1H9UNZ0_9BACI|nr:YheC/YheD family protein [Salipaludibacillus aurantiacus]SES10837.1 YheC/D like ATP-grasp [Salipaludibacillus aurantiacus]